MRLWTRFIVVAIMSAGLAWLLSYLPDLQTALPNKNNELQVFKNNNAITLTNDNIVDWILAVPIQLELKRVDWSDRILTVDFEAGTPIESSKVIFNQLLDFVYYGLGGTTNVDRVWVRLVQTSAVDVKQSKRLLLALDANRTQISEQDYERWKNELISAEEIIKTRFHLTFTTQWSKAQLE